MNYLNYAKRNTPNLQNEYMNSFKRKIFIDKYVKVDNKSVLEIGCSYGTFLDLMKNDNWGIYGFEPSLSQFDFLKQKLCTENIFNDYFSKEKIKNNQKYGLVCFFHVLEHIKNPVQFLKEVYSVLDNEGFICVEVPEVFRPAVDDVKKLYAAGHYYMFNPASLNFVLEKAGFKTILSEKIPILKDGTLAVIACKKKSYEKILKNFYKNITCEMECNYELNQLKKISFKNKKIALFGANQLTVQVIKFLKNNNIIPEVIIDSFYKEEKFNNIRVESDISKLKNSNTVIICSFNNQNSIKKMLEEKGVESNKIFLLFDSLNNIPIFNSHKEFDKSTKILLNEIILKKLKKEFNL